MPGSAALLTAALALYPPDYDDVFNDVHTRLQVQGHATKLDLAALITWKHVQVAKWMATMLALPAGVVTAKTGAAFAPGLTDAARLNALRGIQGFGSRTGAAFPSVLLAAWKPEEFGVFDKNASGYNPKRSGRGWPRVITASCACPRGLLPIWFDHLRQIAGEMSAATRGAWTPRMVDKALLNV
jgi:hypothetical protein